VSFSSSSKPCPAHPGNPAPPKWNPCGLSRLYFFQKLKLRGLGLGVEKHMGWFFNLGAIIGYDLVDLGKQESIKW